MEVHWDDGVNEVERLEIDLWIDMHDTDRIETIVVGARVIAVHALSSTVGAVGTAHRHSDLVAELDEALAIMREIRDRGRPRDPPGTWCVQRGRSVGAKPLADRPDTMSSQPVAPLIGARR